MCRFPDRISGVEKDVFRVLFKPTGFTASNKKSPNQLDTKRRRGRIGSPGRTRTSDRTVNSRLLYQLSYRGTGLKLVQSFRVTGYIRADKKVQVEIAGLGGHARNRTGVHGFAGRCVTTPPRGRFQEWTPLRSANRAACANVFRRAIVP